MVMESGVAIRTVLSLATPHAVYNTLLLKGEAKAFGNDALPPLHAALEALHARCGDDQACQKLVSAAEGAALDFGSSAHDDGITFCLEFVREFRVMCLEEVLGGQNAAS